MQTIRGNAGAHSLTFYFNGDFGLDYIHLVSTVNPPPIPPRLGDTPPPTAPSGYSSVIDAYGQLQVVGTELCDEAGAPIQLRGMSSHGLQWFPFFKGHTLANLVYDWNISVIRPAMYVETEKNGAYWAGYSAQKEHMKSKLKEIVEDALDLGIYMFVDWHIHNDPLNFTDEAVAFFKEMAGLYGEYPNIIYEICNEPEYVSWADIKTYADVVIPEIRRIDPDNIIIVGTADWSQRVDQAAADPLLGYSNIMYAYHFYAGTHANWVRERGDAALAAGLPIFVSEWGVSDNTGGTNGVVYLDEARLLLDWVNSRKLSWINWSFTVKNEASAALVPSADLLGPWEDGDLTASGRFVKSLLTSE